VNAAFNTGYTFTTLREMLSKPGVVIRKLPPALWPEPGDRTPTIPGSNLVPNGGLPPFSFAALHHYLVRFIVANDQVTNSFIL
jgi:hypothetical protein